MKNGSSVEFLELSELVHVDLLDLHCLLLVHFTRVDLVDLHCLPLVHFTRACGSTLSVDNVDLVDLHCLLLVHCWMLFSRKVVSVCL
jgi:hypothetical protein